MNWTWWYLAGAAITGISLYRKPTSLMAAVVLAAIMLFWPFLWLWIIKAALDHAVAKLRRGV